LAAMLTGGLLAAFHACLYSVQGGSDYQRTVINIFHGITVPEKRFYNLFRRLIAAALKTSNSLLSISPSLGPFENNSSFMFCLFGYYYS
jgi:hypothetical protein